jgi:hypothetical protein
MAGDVRDLTIAGMGALHMAQGLARALDETVTKGIAVGRARYMFETMAGGAAVASRELDEMREAVRGTMTDMEMMQMGSEALSIGLVKNVDDLDKFVEAAKVLALTSRAGANATGELVLAMANMSTRRFDQLGLSIVRFKENLEALRASGSKLGKEDMWQAAFWETVQDRVKEVGGVMDKTSGTAVERFKSRWDNFWDEVAQKTAEGVETVLTEVERIEGTGEEVMQEVDQGIVGTAGVAGFGHPASGGFGGGGNT